MGEKALGEKIRKYAIIILIIQARLYIYKQTNINRVLIVRIEGASLPIYGAAFQPLRAPLSILLM